MGILAKKIGKPDPEEAGEDPKEEATESPADEQAEESQEPDESEGSGPDDEGEGAAEGESSGEGEQGEGMANASPQEQAMYNAFVIAAETLIFQPPYRDATLQKLKDEAANPALGIGHTAAMIALSIQGGAKKEGQDIPDDVMYAGGQEVVADLLEVAIAAGIVKQADRDKVYKEAVFQGLKAFGDHEKMSGQLTPQVQQQAKAAMQTMTGAPQAPTAPPSGGGQGAVASAMQPPQQPPTGA